MIRKKRRAGTPTLPDVLLAMMLRSKRAATPTKMYSTLIIVSPVISVAKPFGLLQDNVKS
jgi:hypothetical protein